MKILFINHEFPPNGGGAATIMKELFDRFDNSLHKVYLLTANAERPKINIFTINTGRKSNSTGSIYEFILFFIRGYYKLNFLKTRINPDIVFAFFSIPGGLLAYFNKRKFNIPYIVSIRGGDIPGFQLGKRHEILQTLAKPIIKLVCRNATLIHVNSQRLKNLTLKLGIEENKIKYLPNGINIQDFQLRENLMKNRIRFLFTGRLSKQKNLSVFIKALAMVKFDFSFTIIGSGPEKRKLFNLAKKHYLQNKITFLRWTNRSRLKNYYRDNNVFVLPSLDEGMSNSALEAVENQCALLSSSNAHLQWNDKQIMTDWVVEDYRNPIAWKNALENIHQNYNEINDTSKKMKKFIMLNNNWDILFSKYKTMVEQCVV